MSPDTPLPKITRLREDQARALKKLGIETARDLLYHFPASYGDLSDIKPISSLAKGETAVVFGKITKLKMSKGFRTKIAMASAMVEDESGAIKCVWFNQPYLAKMIPEGALVRLEGKVSGRKGKDELYFSNPKVEKADALPSKDSLFEKKESGEEHVLYATYPESRGVTSNWISHAIDRIFKGGALEAMEDPLPAEILERYNLPTLRTALIWMHTPMKTEQAEVARKRFAFEEIFFIQLQKQAERREYEKNPAFEIQASPQAVEGFVKRFPFPATEAQNRAIDNIVGDMKSGKAMSRLLEGDVGSGKTAVAAAAAYSVVTSRPAGAKSGNLQVAYMCPTEILATQHFESFIKYFSYLNVQVGLITGSGCRKFPSKVNPKGWTDISRSQLLKWLADGSVPILIGTHALIQKEVKFKHLALAIIDEQHRFGTRQRAELIRKNGVIAPHLLSMTATPIPRTLALTLYGDLDLTLLDQMPHGRKPVITEIAAPARRDDIYEEMRRELAAGRQAYVICPRIDEPDPEKELAMEAKSVKAEAKRLKKEVFPEYEIGVLHSKMTPDEKDKAMLDFTAGKINILCATSVVEVGVNVPNATVIAIEGAERFGLAQLHQLRGRVMRSTQQAYCFLFTDKMSDKAGTRLKNFTKAKNGFELAEFDLAERGAGGLSGLKQWGVSDIAMDALKNLKMVEAARTEAGRILDEDASLAQFPLLQKEIARRKTAAVHFE